MCGMSDEDRNGVEGNPICLGLDSSSGGSDSEEKGVVVEVSVYVDV